MSKKIIRDLSTPEKRAYWAEIEKTAAEVRTWPDWKRAGINVKQMLDEPRVPPEPRPTRKCRRTT